MPYNPYQFTNGDKISRDRINSLRIVDIIPRTLVSNTYLANNATGTDLAWRNIITGSVRGLFFKSDPSSVVFKLTDAGTASVKAGTIVDVGGESVLFSSETPVTMPTLTAGTDYAVWVKSDGTIQASNNHAVAPGAGTWRKIGGFHYAPGGNATAQSGGNTTPQINEYSFWDLKFRPVCPDPRGMTLVANTFWSDIYLTCQNAATLGLSSVFNQVIADGSSPPIVPVMFGGNGTTNYGGYTWYEAQELAMSFGKRCPTQPEFMVLAYGTTEGAQAGSDPVNTVLRGAYTSKWGVMLSTGNLYIFGSERGGPFGGTGAWYAAGTEGRGQEIASPNVQTFASWWNEGANIAGSRCSYWGGNSAMSFNVNSSRFVCDHLIAE